MSQGNHLAGTALGIAAAMGPTWPATAQRQDMEMSCDEAVIKELSGDVKRIFIILAWPPLDDGSPAFLPLARVIQGQNKNVYNYKKPALWMAITSFLIVFALGFGLAANQKTDRGFKMSGNHAIYSREKSLETLPNLPHRRPGSIGKMFPLKYHQVFDDRDSDGKTLKKQEQVYAKVYLSKSAARQKSGIMATSNIHCLSI